MLRQRVRRILLESDPTMTELLSGMLGIGWGLWLFIPIDSFNNARVFIAMRLFIPELVWAAMMLIYGLIHVAVIIHGKIKARKPLTLIATMLWMFIATMFAISNPYSTGTLAYAVMALFMLWAYLRLDVFNHL